jgi:hypothetical protein
VSAKVQIGLRPVRQQEDCIEDCVED